MGDLLAQVLLVEYAVIACAYGFYDRQWYAALYWCCAAGITLAVRKMAQR